MRILLDYRPALRERTGVGEYVHRLAEALVQVAPPSDQVVIFSSSWKDRLRGGVVPGAREVDARVPVSALNLLWHRGGWPPVDWFAGAVDVTQAMHPIVIPARRAAQFITVNDLHFLDCPEHTAAEIRRDYGPLAAGNVRRADGVVVISAFMRDAVERRLGADPDRVVVCPPGAPPWGAAEPEPHPCGPILFVGTLEPRKNVATLLRAYAQLVSAQPEAPPMVLVGRHGPGSETLANEVGRPPLAGRVRLTGYVSDEDRQRLYREASMLVLPSLDEGFGLPALEAMTVGVPVIASDRGALPEVLGGAGLLINPEEPESITAAMSRLLGETALRTAMTAAGLARARAYSWTASAARLHAAYVEAVHRRERRS